MMRAPHDEMAWLPTDEMPLDEAAQAYARAGFRVLPVWGVRHDTTGAARCTCGRACTTIGKHPIGKAWQKAASTSPDAVRDARRARPTANIGLAMGGPERLVAVDIDGEAGRASWAALEEAAGQAAPLTLTSRSGRVDGGEHRLFRVPEHLDMKRLGNRASFRHAGIDTRIDGGQIVVAPSLHASGSRYAWTVRAPIAELPEWLFEALASPVPAAPASSALPVASPSRPAGQVVDFARAYVEKALENAARDIQHAGPGERNHKLFAKACTIFEYYAGEGIDHLPAWNALSTAAQACGLPSPEVGATLSKAWSRAAKNPKRVPPPKVSSSRRATPDLPEDDPDPAWEADLDRTAEGLLKKGLGNVITILGRDPRWRGVVAWDAFAEAIVTTRPAPVRPSDRPALHEPGEWTEEDSVRTSAWLATEHALDVGTGVVDQAIMAVARKCVVHPVRDYLSSLTWDGTPRLDTFLVDHFGAPDSEYTRGVSARWMISAVARVFEPGCQADCTLVLESREQGLGKSSGIKALVPTRAWFADTGIHVGDKDSYQCLRRKWVYELGELSALKGRELEKVKGFLSAPADNYRASFGKRNRDFLRQVIFCGTTNEEQYLADRTGNRRFWPVAVRRSVDVKALAAARDQLWAEAAHRYQAGEPWHVNTPEFKALCEEQQADRTIAHPWLELVERWLERPWLTTTDPTDGRPMSAIMDLEQGIMTTDLIMGAIGKKKSEINRADEMAASEVFRELGWVRVRGRQRGRRAYRFFPPKGEATYNPEQIRDDTPRPSLPPDKVGTQVGPDIPESNRKDAEVSLPSPPENVPPCAKEAELPASSFLPVGNRNKVGTVGTGVLSEVSSYGYGVPTSVPTVPTSVRPPSSDGAPDVRAAFFASLRGGTEAGPSPPGVSGEPAPAPFADWLEGELEGGT